ncbi:MAG TPA: rhombosortase [Woeseiaceae bacterium]|nr:rhombosortase [Woeseiaceae bacterium]
MRRVTHWQVPLVIGTASVLAAALGGAGRLWLRWDREGLAAGEFWRLATGHFVHLNPGHLVLNFAGLALVWVLVGGRYGTFGWCAVIAFSIAVMDAGFWFLDPGLSWYVGLSGLLHGLLMAGTVDRLRDAPLESAVLGLLVIGKLAWEQYAGPLPGSEISAGGPVVVNAHLYGAIAGTLAGTASLVTRTRARKPAL